MFNSIIIPTELIILYLRKVKLKKNNHRVFLSIIYGSNTPEHGS